MSKGELENRDAEELGDLPDDLLRERHELTRYGGRHGDVPADMLKNAGARAGAANAPLGVPQLDFDVRSVYDSRPVQGRDFNQWFQSGAHGNTSTAFLQCMTVPVGWVFVVRRIMLRAAATLVWTGASQYLVAVTWNSSIVMPEQQPAPVAPTTTDYIPMDPGDSFELFLIADEGDTVGVQLFNGADGSQSIPDQTVKIGFYGNMLLKTGVPSQFQIANYAGTKGRPYTIPTPSGVSVSQRTQRNRDPYRNVPIVGRTRPPQK